MKKKRASKYSPPSELYFSEVEKHFKFLETDYSFRLVEMRTISYERFVSYEKGPFGIRVTADGTFPPAVLLYTKKDDEEKFIQVFPNYDVSPEYEARELDRTSAESYLNDLTSRLDELIAFLMRYGGDFLRRAVRES